VPISNLPTKAAQKENQEHAHTWVADLAAVLGSIAWPLVAGIIVFRLLRAPQLAVLLAYASRRVTQVSVAGVQLQLSEGAKATLDDLQTLLSTIPETHQEWVKNTHVEDEFQLVISDLRKYLCTQSITNPIPIDGDDFGTFRFTLHVPDVLLTHSLRQLVDYIGNDRGGGGRMFSSRRGIMGLAWRLQESHHNSHAAYTEDELVAKWGMTRAEAKYTKAGKTVFLVFVIRSEQGLPVALFYADSANSKLFEPARTGGQSSDHVFKDLTQKVNDFCKERGLTSSLEQLEKVRITLKQVDIYDPKPSH
jgi:hypothetical protein